MTTVFEKYHGISRGTPAPGARIPITTPLAPMQRPLNIKKVEEYVSKSGGIDWNLFGYATAVQFPDGRLQLINGQHRIHAVSETLPSVTEVPAHIISLSDAQYAAVLFDYMNGGASSALKSEDQFYAKLFAKDAQALELERILKLTKFNVGQVNAASNHRQIKYANFVKCVKFSEIAFLQAAHIIDTVYPNNAVNDNFLSGLSRLFSLKDYNDFGDPTTANGKQFINWLTTLASAGVGQKTLEFKKLRNAGPWYDAAAYGLCRAFLKQQRGIGRKVPKVAQIKAIYDSHFKDEDDSDSIELF
jgi:hypothetical protein